MNAARCTGWLPARNADDSPVAVVAIAMEGGINANLLFGWRRKHLDAVAQADGAAPGQPAAVLLPVSSETAPTQRSCTSSTPPMRPGGAIEIEIGNARIRLHGSVDEASLRTVLTALRSLAWSGNVRFEQPSAMRVLAT